MGRLDQGGKEAGAAGGSAGAAPRKKKGKAGKKAADDDEDEDEEDIETILARFKKEVRPEGARLQRGPTVAPSKRVGCASRRARTHTSTRTRSR